MRLTPAAALTLVLLGVASTAVAQIPCQDDINNDLPNCSFEAGTPTPDFWSLGLGDSFQQSTSPARTGSGSAEGDAFDVVSHKIMSITSDCFEMPASGAGYGFGARFRLLSGSLAGGGCVARLFWYPNLSCGSPTANQQGSPVVPDGSANWLLSAGTAATVGTHARLTLECVGAGDFIAQIDDAYAGPGLTMPVTLQGFTVE